MPRRDPFCRALTLGSFLWPTPMRRKTGLASKNETPSVPFAVRCDVTRRDRDQTILYPTPHIKRASFFLNLDE